MIKRTFLAAILSIVSGVASFANAAGGVTLEELATLFEANDVTTDIDGEDMTAQIEGFEFSVSGFNCSSNQCTEFLFFVGFDIGGNFPIERINEWNWTSNAGRASLDEVGDPFIDHAFSISGPEDSGVVSETLSLWASVLVDFMEFIGWTDATV